MILSCHTGEKTYIIVGQSENVMKTIKMIFASLLNNGVVIQGKDKPWYIALILFLMSILTATYPTFTQYNSQNGSSLLQGSTYRVEEGLVSFSESLYDNDLDLVVNEEVVNGATVRYLSTGNQSPAWPTVYTETIAGFTLFPYFAYQAQGQTRLRVFFQDNASDEDITPLLEHLLTPTETFSPVSFLFFGRYGYRFYKINPLSIATATYESLSATGRLIYTYQEVPLLTNISQFIALDNQGLFVDPIIARSNPETFAAYYQRALTNWSTFLDQSYLGQKITFTLTGTGLALVLNTIMALLMSLVIFFMTRGKMNPNNTMRFGQTMKIGAWSLLSPALLTLIVSGIFPDLAGSAFVLLVGLRLMWLSSKYLRPLEPLPVAKK